MSQTADASDVVAVRHERRGRVMRGVVVAGTLIIVAVLAVWAHWVVQNFVILHDDTERGERLGQTLRASEVGSNQDVKIYNTCKAAAEAFYGRGILDGHFNALPSERAFYVGCSGVSIGGYGGGNGD